jgi:hypothetical protein
LGFIDGGFVAKTAEIIGSGEASGSTADDRNSFAAFGEHGRGFVIIVFKFPIDDKAFDVIVVNRRRASGDVIKATTVFAGSGTDAATGKRQRVAFTDNAEGVGVAAFGTEFDVLFDVYLGRAELAAGFDAFGFVIEVHEAFGEGVDADDPHRASAFAGTAADAFGEIDDGDAKGAHAEGVELASADAGAEAEAAITTVEVAAV